MLALAFILVALPALSLFLFISTRTKITAANGYRIRSGMTLAEVEAVLGGPPRIEGRRTRAELASYKYWAEQECTEEGIYYSESGNLQRAWYSDEAHISVAFQGERVTTWGITADRGLLGRMEEWLRSSLKIAPRPSPSPP
jgi:hypothetical protein